MIWHLVGSQEAHLVCTKTHVPANPDASEKQTLTWTWKWLVVASSDFYHVLLLQSRYHPSFHHDHALCQTGKLHHKTFSIARSRHILRSHPSWLLTGLFLSFFAYKSISCQDVRAGYTTTLRRHSTRTTVKYIKIQFTVHRDRAFYSAIGKHGHIRMV